MPTQPSSIDVSDLILGTDGWGTPWSVMHCGQLAALVLSRPAPGGCGLGLDPSDVWTADGVGDALERLEAETSSNGWELIGTSAIDAQRLGDVIVSRPARGPSAVHLAVVAEEGARVMAVTTSQKTGAVLIPTSAVAHVQAVYRWSGGE